MDEVLEQIVVVGNTRGLHARPASMLSELVLHKDVTLTCSNGEEEADCSSVLSLLMLAAGRGTELTLRAGGKDARKILDAAVKMFAENFGEE